MTSYILMLPLFTLKDIDLLLPIKTLIESWPREKKKIADHHYALEIL